MSVLFETGELNAYVYDGDELYRRKYVRTEGKKKAKKKKKNQIKNETSARIYVPGTYYSVVHAAYQMYQRLRYYILVTSVIYI